MPIGETLCSFPEPGPHMPRQKAYRNRWHDIDEVIMKIVAGRASKMVIRHRPASYGFANAETYFT